MKKSLWTLLAVGWMAASSATPPAHLVDSLKSACQSEPDARKRVDILLNLKDLNDSSEDELYYSRKLFDEAAAVGDGFAVGASLGSLASYYISSPGAGDSLARALAQAEPALSADREVLLDCAPYAEENAAAITVADRYTIRNDSGEDCTVTVLYPFVSSLSDLDSLRPSLTADGAAVRSTLYPGAFPGWFGPASAEPELAEERWNIRHAESWTEYQTLLTGSYQADALAPKTLPEQTVYVYSFTASGNTTASAATLAITVDADPEQTTILTYGINGYGLDDATGQPQYSYFTNEHGQSLHLLAVLGQDLSGYAMQGYTDGSCEQGKELDALEGTAAHTEMTLADFLRQTAAAQLGTDASSAAVDRLAAGARRPVQT